ncbi:MAG: hypothetical protein AAGI15_11435 [Pseudomonadota bacterium]
MSNGVGDTLLRIFALAGPLFAVLLVVLFWGMGFLPPLAPTLSAEALVDHYAQHRTGIRLGATAIMQLCMLGLLWTVAIGEVLERAGRPALRQLAAAQRLLGVVTYVVLIFPCIIWTVAAFRPERDPQLLLLLNDLGWLGIVMPILSAVLQALVIGVAVLLDDRPRPAYPRWAGYLNFWCALLFLPGALATFFKTGPFAWNGLFDFWLPVVAFVLWICVVGALTARAVGRAGG